jgi:quercetin dioxygenase-like cupin family protein
MDRLRALTQTLTDMSSIVVPTGNGMQEYKVEQGFAMAMSLKHNEEVAVAQSFLSKGTVFPYHNHENSEEVLIVYSGEVTVVTENDKHTLTPGDSLHICQGCGHLLHAKTDVKIIAITIPPDAVAMPKLNENGQE